MSMIGRTKNTLMVIVGQSNETKGQPSPARPILYTESLTSPDRTRLFVGQFHSFTLKSQLRAAKVGSATDNSVTITGVDTESVTVLNSSLNTSTFTSAGAYIYDNDVVQTSDIGCPNSGTGMWTHLTTAMWEQENKWVQTVDCFSQGGSSFITQWCGTTGSGDASVVLSQGDSGFDPNNYLSDMSADLSTWSNSFDECLVIIQHGQADADYGVSYNSTNATTDASQRDLYTNALTNMVQYLKSTLNPTRILMGSSHAGGVGASTQDSNGFANVIVPAMRDVIASESIDTGVMLSEELGLGTLHNLGDAHLNTEGQIQAGRLWVQHLAKLPPRIEVIVGSYISPAYSDSDNLPEGRDWGTKRYTDNGEIIPNYIHTNFPT